MNNEQIQSFSKSLRMKITHINHPSIHPSMRSWWFQSLIQEIDGTALMQETFAEISLKPRTGGQEVCAERREGADHKGDNWSSPAAAELLHSVLLRVCRSETLTPCSGLSPSADTMTGNHWGYGKEDGKTQALSLPLASPCREQQVCVL